MLTMLLVTMLSGLLPSQQKNDQPLVSATNPVYLSCTVWTGRSWTKPAGRSARTPIKQSPKGYRAYGEVSVVVHGEDCENTTSIFVAAPDAKDFKLVFSTSESGGNGIRLLGWSPIGDRLLGEITFWTYESDIGFGFIPVIYDVSTNSAKEVRAMDDTLMRILGKDCGFEDHVQGWENEQRLLVRISPYVGVDEDEGSSCVKEVRWFFYDLKKDLLQPTRTPLKGHGGVEN
jgi:hypothetical protein